jgi:hypothetical protein
MAVPDQVIHREAMVLTCLVHDLIEFRMASTSLFGFIAFLFLDTGHELASMLMILLCQWGLLHVIGESQFIFAATGNKAIFAVSMLVG